ncbi:MAG: FKBP-type peptidyl-prolyl cis-trans isomerase [Pseudomonadota bacterium]|nr:FKBP-type peptidyl-prolyl cis-trans isomerase [Pseudomonadota bacterium]
MKRFFIGIVSAGLASGVWATEQPPELKDQKDKSSYAVGYQLGENLVKQQVPVNVDAVLSGVREALAGQSSRLTPEETKAAREDLRNQVREAREKKLKEQAAKNLEAGKAFLEENAKKEGVQSLPSGLQYKVITEGSGPSPQATDTVTVHYSGKLTDGMEFDSSHRRKKPASFRVNGVIKGWTEGLQLMQEGAKWELVIPPELGYGERGAPPRIPGNSVLVFEVELLSVKPADEAQAPTPKEPEPESAASGETK